MLFLPDQPLQTVMLWGQGVPGQLEVEGQRLDVPAPPMRVDYTLVYGTLGSQSVWVEFPSEGCWEVVGRVRGRLGEARLRVVVLVVRLPFRVLEADGRALPVGIGYRVAQRGLGLGCAEWVEGSEGGQR
ncbi:MAG: hypothetical protein C4313_04095 [Thermoflexus sp.]|uniref:hypothetical protein n=1 Tax=Thermoflexus sp. TaxID=1969742 RepID=UPI00332F4478